MPQIPAIEVNLIVLRQKLSLVKKLRRCIGEFNHQIRLIFFTTRTRQVLIAPLLVRFPRLPLERISEDSNIQVLPEEFVQDKQLMAQRLAQLDGASSSKPYVEKLTQIGKSCYEIEIGGYRSVEAVAPDVARLTAFVWTLASERGIKISNLEVLQALERALQTDPQVNCDTTLFFEMQRLYPQQWK